MKFCMGIDIGTTGVKTVLFDLDGVPRGTGLSEYALETPGPDIVELDPTVYWESVKKAVAQAVSQAKCDPGEIVSAGITGQAETLVYETEKNMKELDQALSDAEKADINGAKEALQKALEANNIDDI